MLLLTLTNSSAKFSFLEGHFPQYLNRKKEQVSLIHGGQNVFSQAPV